MGIDADDDDPRKREGTGGDNTREPIVHRVPGVYVSFVPSLPSLFPSSSPVLISLGFK